MLKPQNGSIAIGSRRTTPTAPLCAAVVSDATEAPTNTPWFQSNDCITSGAVRARRPPKTIAEIGTPFGSSQCGEIDGHCDAGAVKREFGWAAFSLEPLCQSLPRQSIRCSGTGPSMPSHHGQLSSVTATLVKMLFLRRLAIAFGLVLVEVPGATPKKPASGLIAHRRPSGPGRIQQMSSPTVHTFQPFWLAGGTSMARLVLPQALGNAAATYVTLPCGSSIPTISMCSAIQPSWRPMKLA